jgi:HK97 gp10 family phage protein
MSDALTIQFKGLAEAQKLFGNMAKTMGDAIDVVLDKGADVIVTQAKRRAPVDMGLLRNEIGANKNYLSKSITVNAFYAAFIEFGTGRYAAQYVAGLPADWNSYAATFRAKGASPGTLDEFLLNMIEWVKRKGIHGTTASGRSKKGKKADADAYNIAYVIVISILRNGIHPHPFLYPAFAKSQPEIQKQITEVLQRLTQL